MEGRLKAKAEAHLPQALVHLKTGYSIPFFCCYLLSFSSVEIAVARLFLQNDQNDLRRPTM
eukprot:2199699-Pleurochrysis_carterae.AAC.1